MWERMLHSRMMCLVTREKAQLVKYMSGKYEKLSLAPPEPTWNPGFFNQGSLAATEFIEWISLCVSQLVFSVCWNPKEAGSNASEGMDVLARQEQGEKEQKLPFSVSLYRLPAEGMAQTHITYVSLHIKIWIKCVYLLTSKVWTRMGIPHFNSSWKPLMGCLDFCTVVHSKWSQVDNQE